MVSFENIRPMTLGAILLLARLLSARYSVILDCDEVFNYWEPAHFLVHGWGFQTWEYAPQFGIRSWAYILPHALFLKCCEFAGLAKRAQFLALRTVLGCISCYFEIRTVVALRKAVSNSTAFYFFMTLLLSPADFVAFLPSSFAMYCAFRIFELSCESRAVYEKKSILRAAMVGGLLAWPFSMAISLPILLHSIANANFVKSISNILTLAIRCAMEVLIPVVLIDSLAYRSFNVVPVNIVLYNVFGRSSGRGPELYGVEPSHFYLFNLFLNFNVFFLLALASPFILIFVYLCDERLKPSLVRALSLSSASFYLWLLIFSAQPHKEERFMFVCYPALLTSASISLDCIGFHIIPRICSQLFFRVNRLRLRVFSFCPGLILVLFCVLSVSRILALVSSYSAPFEVYQHVNPAKMSKSEPVVCIGDIWYQYPSSFLLPDGVRAGFVEGEFDGLLPGLFPERPIHASALQWSCLLGSTRQDFNDRNLKEPTHYVTTDKCDYMVTFKKANVSDSLDADVVSDLQWRTKFCRPFADKDSSGFFGRVFWSGIYDQRQWGSYCLQRKRHDIN